MNYGLQLAASGMFTSMYAMDVAANNLANIETAGFKPDMVSTRMREAVRPEDGLWHLPSNDLLERLGGGVLLQPNRISFGQGALETTGNPLDVAIEGDGFFVVSSGQGTDEVRYRFTRDGRFTLDPSGRLVMATGGHAVLDTNDRPIHLDPGAEVTIDPGGSISQDGSVVATIQLADIADRAALTKIGQSLFGAPPNVINNRAPATGALAQRHVERSSVDSIQAMMAVSKAAGSVTANARMIQAHDELLDSAVNRLGRVA